MSAETGLGTQQARQRSVDHVFVRDPRTDFELGVVEHDIKTVDDIEITVTRHEARAVFECGCGDECIPRTEWRPIGVESTGEIRLRFVDVCTESGTRASELHRVGAFG